MNENTTPQPLPADAESINAIVDALGALVICLAKQMPAEAKDALASDLARLSATATATGKTAVGRLMGDLSRAAAA
jgi:hypothetical protein